MKLRYKILFLIALLGPTLGQTFEIQEWSFGLGYSYREDSLNWNIAGDLEGPNILSELRWENLRINQATAAFTLTTCSNIHVRGYADYGKIFHGDNRDSDYAGNNRTEEFSRSIANAGKGEVFDLSGSVGYRFSWLCERVTLIPLVGGSWHEQHLRIFDGVQVIPDLGDIDNLHSSYKTRWYSLWLGADLSLHITGKLSFFAGYEYHWALYRGQGHWNLREDFLSDFKHRSHGHGSLAYGGINYDLCGNWGIAIGAGYQDWRAVGGTHAVKVEVPLSEPETIKTRLNAVNWHSFQASLLLTYSY